MMKSGMSRKQPLGNNEDGTAIMASCSKTDRAPEVGVVFDAIVVGAGFAGLYMLHRLKGMGLKARV